MGKIFRSSTLSVKQYFWIFVLSAIICSCAILLTCLLLRPVYQASAYMIVDSSSSPRANVSRHEQGPVLAKSVVAPQVLDTVIALHPGMSRKNLLSMLAIRPQTNQQVLELDAQAADPLLAASVANQVGQSFALSANSEQPYTVQVIRASVPLLPRPSWLLEVVAIASVAGLALILLVVLLFRWRDSRTTNVERIQQLLGREVIMVLPAGADQNEQAELESTLAEKYAQIWARLTEMQADNPCRLIGFSGEPGEGKAALVGGLAARLAETGKQILLIDFNIHAPVLARELHLNSQIGLTNLLAREDRQARIEYYAQATSVPGLHVLAAGTQKLGLPEFLRSLASSQFFSRLKQSPFDYVLFDIPPLRKTPDTQFLLSLLDAIVVTMHGVSTSRRMLTQTRRVLWKLPAARVLGVVVYHYPWRDYTRIESFQESQATRTSVAHAVFEQTTQAFPTLADTILGNSEPGIVQEEMLLQNTGETEAVSVAGPDYVIRPMLSLNGLAMPTNGLTGRFFGTPHTPQPL